MPELLVQLAVWMVELASSAKRPRRNDAMGRGVGRRGHERAGRPRNGRALPAIVTLPTTVALRRWAVRRRQRTSRARRQLAIDHRGCALPVRRQLVLEPVRGLVHDNRPRDALTQRPLLYLAHAAKRFACVIVAADIADPGMMHDVTAVDAITQCPSLKLPTPTCKRGRAPCRRRGY